METHEMNGETGSSPLPFDDSHDEGMTSPAEVVCRVCNKCKKSKPLDCYYNDNGRRDKYKKHPVCKECVKVGANVVARLRKTAPAKPSVCECCGRNPDADPVCRGWCLDHDYATQTFRGWICQTCNIGLGHFGDSVEGLMRGIDYLRRTERP